MASKRFENGSEEFLLFQDFWRMCQKHWIVEDKDGYWNSLVNDVTAFCEKYADFEKVFAVKIAFALLESCEEKHKAEGAKPAG